jgi:hypothetical protein
MVAENFNSFGQALINKLVAEIAQGQQTIDIAAASRAPAR